MADGGHFIAKPAAFGSQDDSEPFDQNADLGLLPSPVIVSAWRHSSIETDSLPVGDAVIERIGDDLIAAGQLWLETPRGAETHAVLKRLGSRARFSVGFLILKTRPPTADELERGQRRVITRARILEISPVALPAEPSTRLLELKNSAGELARDMKERREIARLLSDGARLTGRIARDEANRTAAELFRRYRRTHGRAVA